MNKITTETVSLIKEGGKYYLDCTFIAEDDGRIIKAHMPRVYLPINSIFAPADWSSEVNIGYGPTVAYPDGDENLNFIPAYTETVLEEKVQEMTLAEVEKKLGYKVKIVNK